MMPKVLASIISIIAGPLSAIYAFLSFGPRGVEGRIRVKEGMVRSWRI